LTFNQYRIYTLHIMSAETIQSEQFKRDQMEALRDLTMAGKWAEIQPQMFPLVTKILVEHAREMAIDERTKYITETRIPQLESLMGIFSSDEKTSGEIFEQLAECKSELKAMILERDTGVIETPESTEILANQIEMKIQNLTERLRVYESWASVDLDRMSGLAGKNQKRSELDTLSSQLLEQTAKEIEALSRQRLALIGK
jgi:hypothetical protein